ncbi:hypothetical protein EDC04DRAFT_2604787 [Pisolithus marmoratus]|nr:hypothetical protein EDC04DRAFT_2604787 [Pisolithus marmoratus]
MLHLWALLWPSFLCHLSDSLPTDTFTFNEDDISMGMISPHISNTLDPAPAASHSTNHPPDFKTEFHPHSKHPTLYQSFEDFGQQIPKDMAPVSELWYPFALEGDYIFVMITVEAGLTSTQVDSLLMLFHHIKQGMTSITLINDAGLCTTLDRVALQLTPSQFSKFEITAPYKGEDVMFQVHACPLWDWALDHFQNLSLTPHFVWDAQCLFKHDGEKYECFYTEPWTGNHWWDIQGYPMVAHCANLLVHIRNGEQYSGGCIVPELVQEERKTSYVNFKDAVWHEVFFKLLKKVAKLSKVGYLYECYDKVLQWLFPIILILSADYEELCVMTLIQDRLWDLSKTYKMCTSEQHKVALAPYMDKKLNVFWSIEHSEPEQAASFEPLHSLHGGMGGKHMHKELKIAVSELGHNFKTKLEEQVSAFPHWQGLVHFNTVIHITFSDGNKMQDVTRQCFYTALNILMTESPPAGYQLLCMMHSYLQLDSLIGLDIQTKKTISMIENELIVFRDELKAYHACVHHLDEMGLKENWNFPKAHLWKHVTHDIQSKGAICNYSAWPNEKMHGPLKDAYQDHSNGKDIAGQILCVDHHQLAIKLIQVCIDAENEHTNLAASNDAGNNEDNGGKFEENMKLGAPQAFDRFHQKLETFLNTCLPTYGYPLNKWIQLQGTHTVHEYQYLKVKHVSVVDWVITTSHLRCSPNFRGQQWYDCTLIQLSETKITFVQLIFFFTCKIGAYGNSFQFALIQPLMAGTRSIIQGALLYPDPNHNAMVWVDQGVTAWLYGDDTVIQMMSKVTLHCAGVLNMPEDLTHALHNVSSDSSDSGQGSDHSNLDDNTPDLKELQELCRVMCELPPDASAPQLHVNCKRAVENNLNTALENNIAAQVKKYCFCYHYWVPKDIFPLMTPPPGYDLNDPTRWSTAKSKISGLKAELYFMLPNNLKLHITYDKFGHVFSNAVGAERPNILKPVKDNAQQLFAHLGLDTDLFVNENSRTLQGSNKAVKVLLKMHPGNVGTCYTPLSPLLFPKPDAPVARDLFKTQLLVNIIWVMIFGKGILAGKCRGGQQGCGQKLGISGTSAGLVAIPSTFAQYLLSSDHELTTIGEENSASAFAAPTWESDIFAQLNGPCQPTSPPCTPSPDLHFSPDSASNVSSPHYIPEVTNAPPAMDSVIISQSANSVTSTHSVDVTSLSLGGTHTPTLPSLSTHGRGLPAAGRPSSSRMANIPVLPPLAAPANTQMPPTKECCTTHASHKGKGK